jgi:DNA-directed RNA polymerase specialized sigma subunit
MRRPPHRQTERLRQAVAQLTAQEEWLLSVRFDAGLELEQISQLLGESIERVQLLQLQALSHLSEVVSQPQ